MGTCFLFIQSSYINSYLFIKCTWVGVPDTREPVSTLPLFPRIRLHNGDVFCPAIYLAMTDDFRTEDIDAVIKDYLFNDILIWKSISRGSRNSRKRRKNTKEHRGRAKSNKVDDPFKAACDKLQ